MHQLTAPSATHPATTSTASTASQSRPKLNPLSFLPGLAFWGLVGTGIATEDERFITAGVVFLGVTLVLLLVRKLRRSAAERAEMARVWEGGNPGRAKILHIASNGGGMNDHPRVEFTLEVTPFGGASYRADTSVIVNQLAIPRVQPGAIIDVRIDPHDRSRVLIDASLTYLGYRR